MLKEAEHEKWKSRIFLNFNTQSQVKAVLKENGQI